MFVLKEKLINSILIKVKGELCVLYSCLISFPFTSMWCFAASLKYEKRKKNPRGVPVPAPRLHFLRGSCEAVGSCELWAWYSLVQLPGYSHWPFGFRI